MEISLKQIIDALIFISIGAAVATPLSLLNVRLAPVLGLIDWPKARGLAEDQVPIIGHSIVLFSLIALVVLNQIYPAIGSWVILTSLIIGLMGHFDDRKPLSAADKLFVQALCVAIVLFLDDSLRESIISRYGAWGAALAGFFILAMINAVNFIDGIDGLAGTVILLAGLGLALFAKDVSPAHAIYGCLLVGMTVPFLYLNVRRRRGFLGNIGSYFFSFLLVTLHLSIPIDAPGIFSRLSLTGLCFLIPIADSLMVITARVMTLRSPFQPDKGHMHHRLVQTSVPLRWILLSFGAIEAGAVMLSVMLSQNSGLSQSPFAVFLCATHVGITGLLVLLIDRASRRRIQSYFERLDSGDPIYFFKYEVSNPDGALLAPSQLHRLEARISAEIRITDYCFVKGENTIFVVLKTMPEPLKGISARLEAIFQSERVQAKLTPDQGEITKVTRDLQPFTHRKSA